MEKIFTDFPIKDTLSPLLHAIAGYAFRVGYDSGIDNQKQNLTELPDTENKSSYEELVIMIKDYHQLKTIKRD